MHKWILSRIEIFVNLKNPLRKSTLGYSVKNMNSKKLNGSTNQIADSQFQ